VTDALEILTGHEAGTLNEEGDYPEDSLLGLAVAKATEYWVMSLQNPGTYFLEEAEEETEEPGANPT
jgi:hypothetical protein